MYKVYLRRLKSGTTKTELKTIDLLQAMTFFMELVKQENLIGKKCCAIFSLDNKQLICHRYDKEYTDDYYINLEKTFFQE